MEIVPALVADKEATVAVQPGEVAFDDPAVPSELGAGVEAGAGDPWGDVAASEGVSSGTAVVGLVGVQLGRSPAWASARALDRGDGVDRIEQDGPLVDVRGGLEADQRDAPAVAHQVVLRPRLAAVGRVRADRLGRRPPFFSPLAGTVALSMLARLQSSRSASPRRSSSV